VIIRPVVDTSSRIVALESGDAQLARALSPEHRDRITQNPSLSFNPRPVVRTLFIGMSNLKKPFSDIRVRQALNYAIDKKAITQSVYFGSADVLVGPVPPGAAGYAPVSGFDFDIERAKQLLREAGYPNGFTATLTGSKGAFIKDAELQQAVQQQLRNIGVTINIDQREFAAYLTLLRTDPTKSSLEMWQDARFGTNAADLMLRVYGCDFFRPQGQNTAGTCFPEIDKLAMQAQRTLDVSARDALLRQAQQQLSQQVPSIWVLSLKEPAGFNKKVHNYVHTATGWITADQRTWIEA